MEMDLRSSAFKQDGKIPKKYTCDGEDLSPPLEWSGVPSAAVTLALMSDDPDAPMGGWVHWIIYNLPASTTSLPEGIPPIESMQDGSTHGMTDFGRVGYGGPCPPSGTHRYFFKLYALGSKLTQPSSVSGAGRPVSTRTVASSVAVVVATEDTAIAASIAPDA